MDMVLSYIKKTGGSKTFSLDRDGIGAENGVHSNGGLQWGYLHSVMFANQFYTSNQFQIMDETHGQAKGVGLRGSVSTVQPYVAVHYYRRVA